jgi:hypothetical protein
MTGKVERGMRPIELSRITKVLEASGCSEYLIDIQI